LDVDRIWTGAVKVLGDIGLEIANDDLAKALAGKLPLKDSRVLIPADVAEHYADEIRTRHGGPLDVTPVGRPVLHNLPLNPYWLDPADGRIKPNDTETVIRNSKLLCQLTDEGKVCGSVAGVPADVPAEMQFLMVHYLACIYSRQPGCWSLMHTRRAMDYIFEVADVMGLPKSIYAESISPLKFTGQSVDLAIEAGRDGVTVGIDPMPVLGVTAPADWHMAWSQSVAENIGSYVLFRECGIEIVQAPSVRLFLANPSASTPYFSAPQHITALLMRRKVREFFGLATVGAELMLVASKAPDQQAAMEKMAGCMLGKVCGFGHIEGAGGLWMDEVFSGQQLIIDAEIARFVGAMDAEVTDATDDIVSVIESGLAAGGFLDSDLALDRFREFAWSPELFDLAPRGSWTGDHQTLLSRAAELADAKADAYTYELDDHRREALDAIIARARVEFD
jgi:trimethylamine--corrinoid protein Co-methyltransferase